MEPWIFVGNLLVNWWIHRSCSYALCLKVGYKSRTIFDYSVYEPWSSILQVMVKKFNLIGVPFQIILGKKAQEDLLEFKEIGKEMKLIKLPEILNLIKKKK